MLSPPVCQKTRSSVGPGRVTRGDDVKPQPRPTGDRQGCRLQPAPPSPLASPTVAPRGTAGPSPRDESGRSAGLCLPR